MSAGRTTADLVGWRVGIERLRVSKSPIGPCYKELLLGKGSAPCGDDIVIGVVAEVRDNVRRDSVPVNAHRPVWITHSNAREVAHREAVIAGDERGVHRGDVDIRLLEWSTTSIGEGCHR